MHGWQFSHMRRALERRARGAVAAATLGLALVGAAGAVAASDKVYTVANYPVEAAAQDAVAAKKKALADGQQAAFRSLLRRLMPVTANAKAKQLAAVQAVDLIDSFRVRSERNSP